MNRRNMMKGMSALMVMTSFAMIASVVARQEGDTATAQKTLGCTEARSRFGSWIVWNWNWNEPRANRSRTVGMISEDSSKFVSGLIFTALPETIVLFGFLALFLL